MNAELLVVLLELAEVLVFGIGAVGLSLAGAYIERFAVATLGAGEVALGGWAVFAGLVVLAFAYLLATERFVPGVRRLRSRLAGTAD